jgi:hypothetical protein
MALSEPIYFEYIADDNNQIMDSAL